MSNSKNENSKNIPTNRSVHISSADDNTRNITVGLIDIDNAIKYYFENVIKLTVEADGVTIPVPVIMGSPERWKSVQKDGFYRDKQGQLICPLIMFRRTGMEKKRTITRNLDANKPTVYQSFERRYTPRNNYDKFSVLTGIKPQKEFYNTVVPDYMQINYECIIWTDYVSQLNKIQEAISYAESSYWGEKDRFNFYAVVNNFTNTVEVSDGTDRVVRAGFDLSIHGYIIPDTLQKDILHYNKRAFSLSRVVFTTEIVESFDKKGVPQGNIHSGEVRSLIQKDDTMARIDPATLAYLRTNKTAIATSITVPDTAIFANTSILTAPSTLPPTSVSDFSFFVNGQYIPTSVIASWSQVGTDCVLVLNTATWGFTLQVDDIVSAFGKFQ